MPEILLINPPNHEEDYYGHIGLATLNRILINGGVKSEILNLQELIVEGALPWPQDFFLHAMELIDSYDANIYGFTATNVSFCWAIKLAQLIAKKDPEAKIIFGGPHSTLLGEKLIEKWPIVDVVVSGEAEYVVVPLVQSLLAGGNLDEVGSLVYQGKSGEITKTNKVTELFNLDDQPFLEYSDSYFKNIAMISLEAGRGCPYKCSFCSSSAIWSRKTRSKSPARLLEEVEFYRQSANAQGNDPIVTFEYDDFIASPKFFKAFVEAKLRGKHDFKYFISTQISHVNDRVIEQLAESGCVSIFLGLETGSASVQSDCDKRLKVSKFAPTISALLEAEILPVVNFIFGFPGETLGDLLKTIEVMIDLALHGAKVTVSILCPEMGSKIFLETPVERYVLPEDNSYFRELREAGLDIERLEIEEIFHSVMLENDSFDVRTLPQLKSLMEELMLDFPLTLQALQEELGTEALVENLVSLDQTESSGFRHGCGQRLIELVLESQDRAKSRFLEFYQYEKCRAKIKNGESLESEKAFFQVDMPKAYFDLLKNEKSSRLRQWL